MKAVTIIRLAATICMQALLSLPTAALSTPDAPQPVKDPRYGKALYDFYQAQYFQAITDIMVAQARSPIKNQGRDPELLLGSLYLSYGMDKAATEIFKRLLDDNFDPYSHDLAWYYLGRLRYKDSRYNQALEAFRFIHDDLPADRNAERLYLMVNSYIDTDNIPAAADTLKDIQPSQIWYDYANYNLGVALIRAGQVKSGIGYLEQVARIQPSNEEQATLFDKANIAIGYAAIHNGTSTDPIAAFSKVRLNGPYSSQALLGIGWAYSATQKRSEALKPWLALSTRNTGDLTMQQALLAIAYTFDQDNQRELALNYYQKAIASYDRVRVAIGKALSSTDYATLLKAGPPSSPADNGEWGESGFQTAALPGAQYINELLMSPDFRRAYQDYRDLNYLRSQVAEWTEKIPLLRTMLEERRRQYNINVTHAAKAQYVERLETLQQQRDDLAKRIADITGHEKSDQLATPQERQRLQQFAKIKARLDRLAAHSLDIGPETRQYHIFYGLTQWRITTEYPVRLWEIKKGLHELDNALDKAERAKASLENVLRITPLNFNGFAERITQLNSQLLGLGNRLSGAAENQLQQCARLIIDALNEKRHEVDLQRDRALYAQARLYDQLSHEAGKP